DYGLPRPLHFTDVILPGAVVVALLAATIVALKRWPKIGFLGAMFFLTLAPTSSLIPIASEVGAERRMYLPLAALSVLLTLVVSAFRRTRDDGPPKGGPHLLIGLLALVVTALAVRTAYRSREFESPLVLWQTSVERWPQGRSRFALGTQLMDAGRHE